MVVLLLILISAANGGPIPEVGYETGGAVQTNIPTFSGVDFLKSRGGVCYDIAGAIMVGMGQKFYLDCGICTCDRYGFWCIPKCSPFYKPNLEGCEEVVDIDDPCCPRKECVRWKNDLETTNPWDKETATLGESKTTLVTEIETVTLTLDNADSSTKEGSSPKSTTQFEGAFTTQSTPPLITEKDSKESPARSETEVRTMEYLTGTDDRTTISEEPTTPADPYTTGDSELSSTSPTLPNEPTDPFTTGNSETSSTSPNDPKDPYTTGNIENSSTSPNYPTDL